MSRPPRERVNAEQAFVDILTAPGAGVAAGVKRPPGFPNCAPFAVLFGNGGDRQTLVTETVTVEATGTVEKLEALLANLEPYGVRELVQSGSVAIGRGPRSITDRAFPHG